MKPRLLIIELHHLGDAVLSLPFVRGAQADYQVHVLCRPATRAVYELMAAPPIIHVWEPPWTGRPECSALAALSAARTQGLALRTRDFQIAVCAWADARAGLIMTETGAGQRIGFPMTRGNYYAADHPWRKQRRLLGRALEQAWGWWPTNRPMLTRNLHRAQADQSHLGCWEQIAGVLDLAADFSVPWFPSPDAAADVLGFVREAHDRGQQVLAIHPHARLPGKQWPHAQWCTLLAAPWVRERFALLEVLPPDTSTLGLEQALSISTPTISSLAATLAAADALLGHDSMPAHLAAALGKPVVTIFGSGEPDWFAPWQNRHRAVIRRRCPLHPCIDQCGMDRYLCVENVSIDDVIAQLAGLPGLS
ncbi:MAG: glycosyltransferase family 9 protein [Chthoniobacterales bacterium]